MAGLTFDDVPMAASPQKGGPVSFDDVPKQQQARPSAPSGFARGLRDPLDAAAQLMTHILPVSVVDAGDRMNNWLADKGVPLAKLPERNGRKTGLDGLIQQQEAEYQAQRTAAGEKGFDGSRMVGNMASLLVPGAAAAKTAQAIKGAGTLAQAAASGVASGAFTPVLDGDSFAMEKAKQIGLSALMGVGTQGALSGISRLVSPNASVNPDVQTLINDGVRITPWQAAGGWAKALEEKARSLPILGDAITAAHKRGVNDLNIAVLRRGIDKLNQATGGGQGITKGGSEGLQQLRQAASNAYDNLLPKMMADTTEPQFAASMSNLREMVKALPANEARYFDDVINRELTQRLAPNGVLSNQNLQMAQAAIRDKAAAFVKSPDAYQRELGMALKQADQELRSLIQRSNPQYARELSLINEAYRIMKTAQRAGSSVAADDGVFTPAQLHNAVKALDKTKDKRAFAEGEAYLQDISGAGKRVLAQQYPDSGTAGRLFLGGGALASGMANPAIPLSLVGASSAYLPIIQRLLTGAIAARPQAAQGVANQIRQAAPFLAAPGSVIGQTAID